MHVIYQKLALLFTSFSYMSRKMQLFHQFDEKITFLKIDCMYVSMYVCPSGCHTNQIIRLEDEKVNLIEKSILKNICF